MQPAPAVRDPLRSPDGRVRLGWRLLFFALVTFTVGAAATFVLPQGQVAGSAALLIGALVAGTLLLTLDGRPSSALGFPLRWRALRDSGLGIVLGLAVGVLVVALIAVGGGVTWTSEPGSAVAWLLGALGALAFFAIPAAAEEAFLRGYPLQAMAEMWGPGWAIGLTSVAFAALHAGNPGVTALGALNVGVAGVFLGVVYLKTLSLWWATGAHLGWNWVHGYLADVPLSGLEVVDAPLYEGVTRGPAWLGGGGFGPEGSLVATLVVGTAAVWCWKARTLRPAQAALEVRPLAVPLASQDGVAS